MRFLWISPVLPAVGPFLVIFSTLLISYRGGCTKATSKPFSRCLMSRKSYTAVASVGFVCESTCFPVAVWLPGWLINAQGTLQLPNKLYLSSMRCAALGPPTAS